MFLLFQNSYLKQQIQELKNSMSVDNVANVLCEVKEYAARANEINVDTLQMKLMHLAEMGRRFDHGDKELYSMVLQRFLCNKDQPRIGHLVTSPLCSPAEAKVYEKEQKFLKLHGNKGIDTEPSNSNVATKIEHTQKITPSFDQFATMLHFMQHFVSSHQQPPMSGLVQVQIIRDLWRCFTFPSRLST